jgi:hypothetical protein
MIDVFSDMKALDLELKEADYVPDSKVDKHLD